MARQILPENEQPSPLAAALAEALACRRPGGHSRHSSPCPARHLPAALAAAQAVLAELADELEESAADRRETLDDAMLDDRRGPTRAVALSAIGELEAAARRLREVAGLAGEGAGDG
jgi:hypothetical protein